jgi:hypothetical protein
MKKVKIFLTALIVLTVAGGALAFRAKQQFQFARTCDIVSHLCMLDTFETFETTAGGTTPVNYNLKGKPCGPDIVCSTLVTTSN